MLQNLLEAVVSALDSFNFVYSTKWVCWLYNQERVLEYDREKAIERLELAKEKDSLENIKN